MENIDKLLQRPDFISPDVAKEKGEIKRVSQEVFGNQDRRFFLYTRALCGHILGFCEIVANV
jgi:hypothetical protein